MYFDIDTLFHSVHIFHLFSQSQHGDGSVLRLLTSTQKEGNAKDRSQLRNCVYSSCGNDLRSSGYNRTVILRPVLFSRFCSQAIEKCRTLLARCVRTVCCRLVALGDFFAPTSKSECDWLVMMTSEFLASQSDCFFFARTSKTECDWLVMSSEFFASQSSCFLLQPIRLLSSPFARTSLRSGKQVYQPCCKVPTSLLKTLLRTHRVDKL
jgi:hypothetical protein